MNSRVNNAVIARSGAVQIVDGVLIVGIEGEDLKLDCDFEWEGDIAEPPEAKRGEVARVWLYMHSQHGVVLQDGELQMYMQWSVDDPPEEWEFERDKRIKLKQGNGNPFVEMFK